MRALAAAMALVLVASACGGGSDSAELEALREEVASIKATMTAAPETLQVQATTVPPTSTTSTEASGGWEATTSTADAGVWPEGELQTAVSSTITYWEGGGYDFLPFSLSEAPLFPVIVRFEALDPTEVALSDEPVVEIEVTVDNYEMFGPSWRAPQDGIDDGDQTTQVRVSVIATPSDPIFRSTEDLIITVITKDRAPSIDDH